MCGTGIRYTGYLGGVHDAFFPVTLGKGGAAAITHFLYVDALVGRGRITVVNPEEGTDFHFLARRSLDFHAVFVEENDFAGAQLLGCFISEMHECKIFKRCAVCAVLASDGDRQAAVAVAHRIDAFGRHDEHADGALDDLLNIKKALGNRLFLINQGCNELRLIDVAAAHFQEMGISAFEKHLDQLGGVIYFTNCGDGIITKMGTYD